MISLRRLGAIAAAAGAVFGAAGSASAAYITTGNLTIDITYYDSGTVGYDPNKPGAVMLPDGRVELCNTAASCDSAAGQVAGSTPGSGSANGGLTDTQGIFRVNSIVNLATATTLYSFGTDTFLLTGIFSRLTDIYVVYDPITGLIETRSTGGAFKIFQQSDKAASKDLTALQLQTPNAVGADLTNFLFPNISDTAVSVYLEADFKENVVKDLSAPDATFQSSWKQSTGDTGSSGGFLDVTGGTAQSIYDTDQLSDNRDNTHDLYFSNSFNLRLTPINGWNVTNNTGQVNGDQAIPEPASLALAGLALFGVAAASRRRKISK